MIMKEQYFCLNKQQQINEAREINFQDTDNPSGKKGTTQAISRSRSDQVISDVI